MQILAYVLFIAAVLAFFVYQIRRVRRKSTPKQTVSSPSIQKDPSHSGLETHQPLSDESEKLPPTPVQTASKPRVPKEDSFYTGLEDYQTFLNGRGKLPSTLMQANNPFDAYLDDFAPDGLLDRSGVSCWLKPTSDADLHQVLQDAIEWQELHLAYYRATKAFLYPKYCDERIVILLDPEAIPEEPISDPLIRFATVRSATVLYDICDQKEYTARVVEYPGNVDDAATYGEWYLY